MWPQAALDKGKKAVHVLVLRRFPPIANTSSSAQNTTGGTAAAQWPISASSMGAARREALAAAKALRSAASEFHTRVRERCVRAPRRRLRPQTCANPGLALPSGAPSPARVDQAEDIGVRVDDVHTRLARLEGLQHTLERRVKDAELSLNTEHLKNTVVRFVELGEADNGPVLRALAAMLKLAPEDLARLEKERAARAAASRGFGFFG